MDPEWRRGFVRVGTGADAMESLSSGQEGGAAAVMSGGLELGKIIGPLSAGVVADQSGTPSAFYVVPGIFFGLYVLLELRLARARPRCRRCGATRGVWGSEAVA